MNISCRIIEDLMPMYHDGICSADSTAMVETHLKHCSACQKRLELLRSQFPSVPQHAFDDLAPLRHLRKKLKTREKRLVGKGMLLSLAGLLFVLLICALIWFSGPPCRYTQLAKPLERVPESISGMTSAEYFLIYEDHCIVLDMPHLFGQDGFVHVGEKESMPLFLQNGSSSPTEPPPTDLFFYPRKDGYRFALLLDDGAHKWWVWVAPDLTVFEDASQSRTPQELETIYALLNENREEILALFRTVSDVWGIDYLIME